ncbi:cytochrome P450 6A1-like isoform X2 [Sitodiplosis mosellana]|uniref:cytochrome P450 6A1-like isoform X2 n=1 Tax=Sitodiplosis mosellana TaxID=263140 RepID=UPI0024449B9A|nr:cytochrome P450 6A1-like isoform X2 [Sitodiplosis mosellana]
MELISIIAFVLISIITAAYIYFKNAFNYWKSRGIPFEEPIIPYGSVKGLNKTIHTSDITKRIYDKFKGTAKYCGVYLMAAPIAMILDLDLVKHILVKDFSNFSDKGFYSNEEDDPLSANLFTLDGDKWKKLRAKLTPTFTSGKMKIMFSHVVEVGERFNDCLRGIVQENNEVEIKDLLARFTTDVIGTCAFGIECNSLKDPNAGFKNMGEKAFRPRYPSLIQFLVIGMKNVSRRFHVKIMPDDVSEFFLRMVYNTVKYREKNDVHRNDFMDILIKLKNDKNALEGLTLNEIAAQAFLFFLAGFETSSTTLMFCLYELSKNPDIQSKARKVVQEAYEKHETLRRYPPVPFVSRIAKNDYNVPETSNIIEKGTIIVIPTYAIQNDPEYYPDPERFDPDRFAADIARERDTMTWLPFSEGPRNCVGLRFGMMQARTGLAILLNNFEFTLNSKTIEPLSYIPDCFVLNPKGGVHLNLIPIKSK